MNAMITATRADAIWWTPGEVGWDELRAWTAKPKVAQFGYVLGDFGTGDRVRRRLDNCRSRWAVVLDNDHAPADFRDRLAASGLKLLWYTTKSHKAAKHGEVADRYRVIVPLARPVSPAEYGAVTRAAMAAIGGTGWDPASENPVQFMWGPQPGEHYAHGEHDGHALDPDAVQPEPAPKASQGAADRPVGPAGVRAALESECDLLEFAEPGQRNHALNRAAFNLGQLVGDHLPEDEARDRLLAVALDLGLSHDEANATISSGLSSGMAQPRPVVDSAPDSEPAEPTASGVQRELRRMLERAEAKRLFQLAKEGPELPLVAYSQDEADRLPPAPPFRVEGLIPPNGFTAVVAQNKTGKTTFGLNLAYALLTGEDFLGAFPVVPVDGAVAFLNYELDERTFHRWARERGITGDQFIGVHMRGRGSLLGRDREQMATLLATRGVQALIVDPFSRAAVGVDQNDASEVREWLVGVDDMARSAGVRDLVLMVHSGWDGSRSRGSSALEDHPDSKVYLQKQEQGGQLVRTMSAEGRDVDVPMGRLLLDGRVQTFVPGEVLQAQREAAKAFASGTRAADCRDRVLDVLASHPLGQGDGLSKRELQKAVGMDEHLVRSVVDQLVAETLVSRTQTSRGHYHWLNDDIL